MTIEELLAALADIVQGAEDDGDRDLTPEEVERAEEIEGQILGVKASDGVKERAAAFAAPVTPAGVHVGTPTEDDTLERAFNHFLRSGIPNADISHLAVANPGGVEQRAQGEAAGAAGGFLVPEGFLGKMVDRLLAFGGVAAQAETVTTGDGNPIPFPTVDDTSNVGEIVEEGGTFSSGADITFGSKTLGAYKYMAGGGSNLPLRVSVELLQDDKYDIEGLISRKLGQRIGRIQAPHLVTGTGVNQPKGLIHGLTGQQLADDTAGITYNDLVGFTHDVDMAYRELGNCRWGFNDNTMELIEKMVDAAGDPIWRPDNATMRTPAGESTLLGYPVTIDPAFPDVDVDNVTQNWGAFGDFREGFLIRRVADVTLIVNPWTRAANGQVEYTAWARMDAVQQDTNAYVALTGEA